MLLQRCWRCGHYDNQHAMQSLTRCCVANLDVNVICVCSGFQSQPEPDGELERGYHLADIPKGELGEVSKISEEFLEFQDAITQGAVVMQLCELSDMIGAIEGWLAKHHPSITLSDVIKMSEVTKRAFRSGRRK